MAHEYILGIEINECDKETKKYCLYRQKYGDCKRGINYCHFPLLINPICICDKNARCNGLYDIVIHKDKTYILYYCKACKHLIDDFDNAVEKILKPLHSDNIYFGKELSKLCKKILVKDQECSKDIKVTIKVLQDILKSTVR